MTADTLLLGLALTCMVGAFLVQARELRRTRREVVLYLREWQKVRAQQEALTEALKRHNVGVNIKGNRLLLFNLMDPNDPPNTAIDIRRVH